MVARLFYRESRFTLSYLWTPGSPQKLQSAVTAATTQGGILYLAGRNERVTIVCRGSTTAGVIASGNLVIEEAFYFQAGTGGTQPLENEPPWAGPWSVIQTINAVDLTLGATQVVHVMGSIWALRVRVSVVIAGGGGVDVFAWGN